MGNLDGDAVGMRHVEMKTRADEQVAFILNHPCAMFFCNLQDR